MNPATSIGKAAMHAVLTTLFPFCERMTNSSEFARELKVARGSDIPAGSTA